MLHASSSPNPALVSMSQNRSAPILTPADPTWEENISLKDGSADVCVCVCACVCTNPGLLEVEQGRSGVKNEKSTSRALSHDVGQGCVPILNAGNCVKDML